jgi:hypothetical protein
MTDEQMMAQTFNRARTLEHLTHARSELEKARNSFGIGDMRNADVRDELDSIDNKIMYMQRTLMEREEEERA